MHVPNRYFSVVLVTVLISLSSGMAFPGTRLVNANATSQPNSRKTAQVLPQNNSQSQVRRLNQEGIKLSEQGQFAEALQTLEKALAMSQENEERSVNAATLNNIGRVYQNQGRYSQALKYYLQALSLNKELQVNEKTPGQAHIALGKTYSNLGYLFERLQKPELAIFFYKHCVINREKVRLNPAAFSVPQIDAYNLSVAQTYRTLGEALLKGKRIQEAIRIMDLVKVEELEEYLHNVQGNEQTAKGIEVVPAERQIKQKMEKTLGDAVALGKELETLRQIPPQKRTPQQKKRIEELVATQQKILDEFYDFISTAVVTAQVDQISRTARQQNLDLESLNAIRDNLARLPEKSVLLYPLVLKDSLELILVTPESPPIHRTVAVKREKVYQTIAAFRQALQNPTQEAKQPARQLYEWLIKPIENDLKQAGTQTLIYAPDDQLRYIPLSALYDGKQWLVQGFGVNHITAASLTNFNTVRKSNVRVLAAAFTKGSYELKVANRQLTFSGLPFAEREVETLAATVPGTKTILDDAFSPKTTVPQMDDYTIVHLATHAAFVVGEPEDSFILFGNGDRANLRDVATWSLPRVDLVVLSACETGLGGKLGNGEEILGFGYQIQKTGARSAIASLWAVDDGGTQSMMSSFYALLPSGKLTKAQALRQAQIALITGDLPQAQQQSIGGSLTHPYYWAPFILIGNGL
ncbi:CHAT domain-containing protein [Mastigocladopsis repens]|uniref:CHAT domain-containing protein n=1 Tax=Mastigocladopsis repens TaxID=221287 RepID=UPI0003031D44|nr:CHAT domain-containing protein [Mastigocladopsis repens]